MYSLLVDAAVSPPMAQGYYARDPESVPFVFTSGSINWAIDSSVVEVAVAQGVQKGSLVCRLYRLIGWSSFPLLFFSVLALTHCVLCPSPLWFIVYSECCKRVGWSERIFRLPLFPP